MRHLLPLLLLLAASACSTVRQLPSVTDSTKVEVRVVEKIVRDTAYVELPVIVEKVATLDTASVLELSGSAPLKKPRRQAGRGTTGILSEFLVFFP